MMLDSNGRMSCDVPQCYLTSCERGLGFYISPASVSLLYSLLQFPTKKRLQFLLKEMMYIYTVCHGQFWASNV